MNISRNEYRRESKTMWNFILSYLVIKIRLKCGKFPLEMNILAVKKESCADAELKINLILSYATPVMLTSVSSFVYGLKLWSF